MPQPIQSSAKDDEMSFCAVHELIMQLHCCIATVRLFIWSKIMRSKPHVAGHQAHELRPDTAIRDLSSFLHRISERV